MNDPDIPTLDLTIEKLVTGGRGLARHDGEAVFVPLTAPGDTVRARLVRQHKGYREAELVDVVTPGPGRRAAPCPHFAGCGGCDLQHLDEDRQDAVRRAILLECFERLGGLEIADRLEEPTAGPVRGYRNRVRLSQHPTGRYGLLRRSSHDVVPLDECLVMAEPFQDTILPWLRFLPPVDQIVVRLDGRGGWLLSLYGPPNRSKPLRAFLNEAPPGQPPAPGLQGVLLNNRPHWGRSFLVLEVGGHKFRVSHDSFFQGNLAAAEDALTTIGGWLDEAGQRGGDLADCYGGVGLFALGLADRFDRIVTLDADASASRDARENVRRHPLGSERVTVHQGEVHHLLAGPAVRDALDWDEATVILDPPRTGLGKPVLAALAERRPRRLIYLSCDPATLARDGAALTAAGYELVRARPVPMFPQTAHLETLVQMDRRP
jgi:23S rRNA (uracil1939-C5)-methyltransferase